MKRKKLGSVWTDVAALLVGDPCQVLKSERDGEDDKPPTYEEYMDKMFEGMGCKEIAEFENSFGGTGAIAVVTGADGWYPVYMEYDENNNPVRLVIELGGKVNP